MTQMILCDRTQSNLLKKIFAWWLMDIGQVRLSPTADCLAHFVCLVLYFPSQHNANKPHGIWGVLIGWVRGTPVQSRCVAPTSSSTWLLYLHCFPPYCHQFDTACGRLGAIGLSSTSRYLDTQEADSLKCSKPMPKVVVGVPRVLKVFSWVFIYKVHKKIGLGPKKSVQTG